jgi:hypothetical protein
MWIRQWPQQHRVNNAKNRSVRADPEGKHDNSDQSESRILEKLPDGKAEIAHGVVGLD